MARGRTKEVIGRLNRDGNGETVTGERDSDSVRVVELINTEGIVTRIKVTDELVYRLRAKVLDDRSVAIVDGFASEIMPGVSSEHIREVLKADKRRGEKGGGTEPTGTRKTMRECMSRASLLLWDGKL